MLSRQPHVQRQLCLGIAYASRSPTIARRYSATSEADASGRPIPDQEPSTFVRPDFVADPLQPGWRPVARQSPVRLLATYRALSKERLSYLMVLTAMAGYAICPGPTEVAAGLASVGAMFPAPSLFTSLTGVTASHSPVVTLLALTGGTYLLSASTNTINQIVEHPLDAQMPRTMGRPMPRRLISPLHASSFAGLTGLVGVGTLYTFTSPLVAALGATNHILYAFVYTPSKRRTTLNTPIGAAVGAIPPLMGWAAASGTLFEATDGPGWALAAILFAWQFPHFNALAYSLRTQYAQAGYRMLVSVNQQANARSALRGSVALAAICAAMPLYICPDALVVDAFLYGSLAVNGALTYVATRFWWACRTANMPLPGERWGEGRGDKERERRAKQLFYASLAHLPTILILLMLCKTGAWSDLQAAVARLRGEEVDAVKPKALPSGRAQPSIFRRSISHEALRPEEDLSSLSGAEFVEIGDLGDTEDVRQSHDRYDNTLEAPAELDAHVDDPSLRKWKQRATSQRLV